MLNNLVGYWAYIWGAYIRVGLYSGGAYIWNEVSVSICGGLIFGGGAYIRGGGLYSGGLIVGGLRYVTYSYAKYIIICACECQIANIDICNECTR